VPIWGRRRSTCPACCPAAHLLPLLPAALLPLPLLTLPLTLPPLLLLAATSLSSPLTCRGKLVDFLSQPHTPMGCMISCQCCGIYTALFHQLIGVGSTCKSRYIYTSMWLDSIKVISTGHSKHQSGSCSWFSMLHTFGSE
jgi:hypothetical protein